MSKDKNVLVTLTAVVLFALLWFAMYPVMQAWAAREAGLDVVTCEPGYKLEYLGNGGIKVTGVCKGIEPARSDGDEQEPVYDYPYPVPDEPYPYIDNPCDRDWYMGEECEP